MTIGLAEGDCRCAMAETPPTVGWLRMKVTLDSPPLHRTFGSSRLIGPMSRKPMAASVGRS